MRSNRFFKAKRIRDDLSLWTHDEQGGLSNNKHCFKLLDSMEKDWTNKQKDLFGQRLEESLKKKQRSNDFIDIVLKKCKEHNGSVTSLEELKILSGRNNSPDLKRSTVPESNSFKR